MYSVQGVFSVYLDGACVQLQVHGINCIYVPRYVRNSFMFVSMYLRDFVSMYFYALKIHQGM